MPEDRVPLPGSDRQVLPGAQNVSLADPDQQIEVTVLVRSRASSPLPAVSEAMSARLLQERQYLSRAQFAQAHGADPSDLDRVAVWAEGQGLAVAETSTARRSIVLSGTVADFAAAFGVTLTTQTVAGQAYRVRTGPLSVPPDLPSKGYSGWTTAPRPGPRLASGLPRAEPPRSRPHRWPRRMTSRRGWTGRARPSR